MTELDSVSVDARINDLAESLKSVLIAYTFTLNEWCFRRGLNKESEELLKRFVLAVVALQLIPSDDIDAAFELNALFTKIPRDGKTELLESASEVSDLYSYLESGVTTPSQSRTVRAEFAGRFERPDFPILLDAE